MSTTAAFEAERPRLRALAYRMLGSVADADDAVQEAWLRLSRTDAATIGNLGGWLTTVTGRVCMDLLRSRTARREEPWEVHVPDPLIGPLADDPEQHAVMSDAVGVALLVVLDTLSPTERLAFVLHDVFAVPFDQVGTILERSPAAAKQLASRARSKIRSAGPAEPADHARRQQVVDAFLAASRDGDFDGLLAVLDPDVVLRADAGHGGLGPSQLLRGADVVARQAHRYAGLAQHAERVSVNGSPGLMVVMDGRVLAVLAVEVHGDRIVEIDILADPVRLTHLRAMS